ncbi:MAG: YicC family protein [Oscillospiraceae bacterium]|jgi:uncharacterized protein (TIGR00255 family)|nr:YicC family protein [Oscillospiraceae bacterium]
MIKSMTGYGRSQACLNGRDITVEIKSVNHRYFEFSSRTSRGYAFLDEKLKSYVQQRVTRGKVDVYASIHTVDDTAAEVSINHSLAAGYVKALNSLSSTYNLSGELTAATLSRYSDIFTVHKAEEDEALVWEAVRSVLDSALESFVNMRSNEGARLKDDIESRSAAILAYVAKVEERSPEVQREYMQKLRTRIDELLGSAKVDEQRLITEVAIFGDKIAVAEETVRLRSHFEQMQAMLDSGQPIGRKLDFIVQEMNREANTIGSKAQDAATAHIVVEIKSEIEKIREQVQNIE